MSRQVPSKTVPRAQASLLGPWESAVSLETLFVTSLVSQFALFLWIAFWKTQDVLMCMSVCVPPNGPCMPFFSIPGSVVLLVCMACHDVGTQDVAVEATCAMGKV